MKKTVLITGASRGIGAECAYTFARNGYNVIINYNKSCEKAKYIENELYENGFSAISVCADVSDPKAAEKMFKAAEKAFGGVDVLVNNAAISYIKPIQDISLEEWNEVFRVNSTAAFICSKLALPFMIHKKSGSIINISSVWGMTGASCEVHYSASKAALIGFTKALAKELAPSGIRVNCVCPGAVNTDMNSHLSPQEVKSFCDEIPLERFAKPSEIASTVLFLASDAASYITGQTISPNGGFLI